MEWLSDQPKNLSADQTVTVHVTILNEPRPTIKKQQGRRIAAALEKLAKLSSSVRSVDALQWERELRQERTLPGRESDADQCTQQNQRDLEIINRRAEYLNAEVLDALTYKDL